jgi:hypothetical protein
MMDSREDGIGKTLARKLLLLARYRKKNDSSFFSRRAQ